MRQRVLNPKNVRFPYYGGRGITIDPSWDDFAAFLRDLGPRPPGTTLGRIDNSRGYGPGNCRWETPAQQAASRRPRKQGGMETLKGRARAAGIPYHVVYQRVKVMGWDEARALSTPVRWYVKASDFERAQAHLPH